jgi:RNA polymerase sigma factor (sigma-70 family)
LHTMREHSIGALFMQPGTDDTATKIGMVGGGFQPTQWSLVHQAGGGQSLAALEKLCRAYLPPVFAFIRREGHHGAEAEDLTQEFFHRLLAAGSFADATPLKGRFRSWLIGALKHFLHSEWRRGMRQKRGSGIAPLSLEGMEPSLREACEPRDEETPETAYDRRWAETLIARVSARMRQEYELAGQLPRYEALRPYLPRGGSAPGYAETAALLCMNEAAVKSAIFKIRRRFGLLLRHEVAQTVTDPSEVEDEMRGLLAALR